MSIDNPSVLYVEDDELSRDIMYLILVRGMGLQHVTILDDTRNFIERAEQLNPQPDVFLLDIHMQPHSGFDLLAQLRGQEQYRDTPVVALTASVMNEEVHQLKQAGFDGVLAKPVDQDTFPDLLARIINGEKIWRVLD